MRTGPVRPSAERQAAVPDDRRGHGPGLAGRPELADLGDVEDAIQAARRESAGQTRPQIRQRLTEELEIRGLILPPPVVDGFADEIVMLTGGLAGRVQYQASRAGHVAQGVVFGVQVLRAVRRHLPLPLMESRGMRGVRLDPRHTREEVGIEPGGQAILNIDTRNPVSVWLGLPDPGDHDGPRTTGPTEPGTDAPVLVFLGHYRIARLGPEASRLYRPVIDDARASGAIVVVPAMRDRAEDGSWRLYVPWPRIAS